MKSMLFVLLVAGSLLVAGGAPAARGQEKKKAEPPADAKSVGDQAEAIDEARKVDIPLLDNADKVVIDEVAKPGGKGRRVTLKKADELKDLREVLKPSKTPASGGITSVTLTFYHGDDFLRKVWVFKGGEWGFERPGTSWTTGREPALWRVVQKHVK
jgi:hypothetical protein